MGINIPHNLKCKKIHSVKILLAQSCMEIGVVEPDVFRVYNNEIYRLDLMEETNESQICSCVKVVMGQKLR